MMLVAVDCVPADRALLRKNSAASIPMIADSKITVSAICAKTSTVSGCIFFRSAFFTASDMGYSTWDQLIGPGPRMTRSGECLTPRFHPRRRERDVNPRVALDNQLVIGKLRL